MKRAHARCTLPIDQVFVRYTPIHPPTPDLESGPELLDRISNKPDLRQNIDNLPKYSGGFKPQFSVPMPTYRVSEALRNPETKFLPASRVRQRSPRSPPEMDSDRRKEPRPLS
jgi:hypothetical protein